MGRIFHYQTCPKCGGVSRNISNDLYRCLLCSVEFERNSPPIPTESELNDSIHSLEHVKLEYLRKTEDKEFFLLRRQLIDNILHAQAQFDKHINSKKNLPSLLEGIDHEIFSLRAQLVDLSKLRSEERAANRKPTAKKGSASKDSSNETYLKAVDWMLGCDISFLSEYQQVPKEKQRTWLLEQFTKQGKVGVK